MTHTNFAWLLLGVLVIGSVSQQSPAVPTVEPLIEQPIIEVGESSPMEAVEFVSVAKPDVAEQVQAVEMSSCANGSCGVRRGVFGGIFRRR